MEQTAFDHPECCNIQSTESRNYKNWKKAHEQRRKAQLSSPKALQSFVEKQGLAVIQEKRQKQPSTAEPISKLHLNTKPSLIRNIARVS